MKHVVFRTQAGRNIGYGHMARSLRLAKSLTDLNGWGHRISFLYDGDQLNHKNLMEYSDIDWVFLHNEKITKEEKIGINELEPIDLMIVDRLESSDEQWNLWREHSNYILSFSDLGLFCPTADAVIYPQHLDRNSLPIERQGQEIYVGPDYFVLDEKVLECAKFKKINKKAQRMLISLGGWWDPSVKSTIKDFLDEMTKYADISIEWILGKGIDPDTFSELKNDFQKIMLQEYVEDFIERIYLADVVLIGGGFVKYDAMAIGTPSVVISVVDHQKELSMPFHNRGALIYAGSIDSITGIKLFDTISSLFSDFEERKRLSEISKNLMDGRGNHRVLEIIMGYINN